MSKRAEIIERLGPAATLAPDVARGLRAALATLVPFYFAQQLGHRELAWTALGGWLGTLADPGGTRGSRARTLVAFAATGACAVALGEAAAPHAAAGTALLALGAFATSLLRAVGGAAASIGTLLVILLAISVGATAGTPLSDALAFGVGAAVAVVLSSIVWPVWTHLPIRIAVGACFRELAAYVEAIAAACAAGAPPRDELWSDIARVHQRRMRSALEEARAVVMASRARRAGESMLGSNLRALLGSAEHQLALVIALTEEIEATTPEARRTEILRALAERFAFIADAVSRTVLRDVPPGDVGVLAPGQVDGVARRLLDSSGAAMKVAAAPVSSISEASNLPKAMPFAEVQDELRALRDALSVRSTFFRHAARVAIAVSVAQVIGRIVSPAHSAWVTVTTVAVLQPYSGATVKRAVERGVGTVFGSVLALVIATFVKSPLVLAITMVPLSIAAVVTKPRSYRLFTFFLTPIFVVIASRWQGDWATAAARAGDAVVGGAIAVSAALIFPSREEKRLTVALKSVLDALDGYVTVVTEAIANGRPGSPGAVAARREVGITLGAAETSLERLLSEPLRSLTEAEDAVLLVTYTRRLAAAITVLDAHHGPALDGATATALREYVQAAISRARTKDAPPLPEPPRVDPAVSSHEAIGRILRQAELIAARHPVD